MSKRSEAKNKKKLKERFGKLAESMAEYYHHLDLRLFDDLNDEAFAYIMTNVKEVKTSCWELFSPKKYRRPILDKFFFTYQ